MSFPQVSNVCMYVCMYCMIEGVIRQMHSYKDMLMTIDSKNQYMH